jgi:hypothetical protein
MKFRLSSRALKAARNKSANEENLAKPQWRSHPSIVQSRQAIHGQPTSFSKTIRDRRHRGVKSNSRQGPYRHFGQVKKIDA